MRIESKADLRAWLAADARSRNHPDNLRNRLLDETWAFQRALRWAEYQKNCGRNPLLKAAAKLRLRRHSIKLGYTIAPNVFGPGLAIVHRGTIVVNDHARIGPNCRIHVDVNIGTYPGVPDQAPTIGANCYIGPGAKLWGPIEIGDDTVIAATAAVGKSFPQGGVVLGGVPAKVLSEQPPHALTQGWAVSASPLVTQH